MQRPRARFKAYALVFLLVLSLCPAPALAQAADPLPSWNEGATKQSILDFVADVTREGAPSFAPPAERIATFDDDGTLWIEQPLYVQFVYALDRLRALAPLHPEWRHKQPFKAGLEGDAARFLASGHHGLMEIMGATHAGMTPEQFEQSVKAWLATAQHPRFHRLYTQLVYQPMLELLAYLRANGFKTYIVSPGGVDFMRAFAESAFGVPPEQVIGSSVVTKFERRDGLPRLFRYPQVNVVDDRGGKPVGINARIGRRPIAAFGNSDGDLEMLQWTTEAGGRRFGLIVHHTDAEREYAYDRKSMVGRLDLALDAAVLDRWTVVNMKTDWKVIFPPAP